jgi:hypothetical protein
VSLITYAFVIFGPDTEFSRRKKKKKVFLFVSFVLGCAFISGLYVVGNRATRVPRSLRRKCSKRLIYTTVSTLY